MLFATLTIEGRMPAVPLISPPDIRIVELPPYPVVPAPAPRTPSSPAVRTTGPRPATDRVATAPAPAADTAAAAAVPIPELAEAADSAAGEPRVVAGRIGPGIARGRLWVPPLPLPPRELARRLTRSHTELVDSAVTEVVQAFLDSIARDPASQGMALPSWTTTVAGTKFGLDSKYLYVAGLKIPAAVLALLPIPAMGNELKAFDRSGQMYDDLRRAAQRSQNVAEFKDAIREIRERTEREREFQRNQRSDPDRAEGELEAQ